MKQHDSAYFPDQDFLAEYRAHVLLLQEQTLQLELTGTTGTPAPVKEHPLRHVSQVTNAPASAALQLWEGMAQRCQLTRAWLEENAAQAAAIVARVQRPRSCFILGRYYLQGCTDLEIAAELGMSREHVNRLRRGACQSL